MAAEALLSATGTPSDPAMAIVDAAATATLTAERLDELITEAAWQQARASYGGDLKRRIAPLLIAAFHQALADGGADEILDSLRSRFDTAAEAIATARDLIPTDQPAEAFLHDAKPAALAAWQSLGGHITIVDAIAAIAAAFGPRNGRFPLITEYSLADGFRLDDRAIVATDGPNLESDSAVFKRPDAGHRSSPWFRLPLRLHTVDRSPGRYHTP